MNEMSKKVVDRAVERIKAMDADKQEHFERLVAFITVAYAKAGEEEDSFGITVLAGDPSEDAQNVHIVTAFLTAMGAAILMERSIEGLKDLEEELGPDKSSYN